MFVLTFLICHTAKNSVVKKRSRTEEEATTSAAASQKRCAMAEDSAKATSGSGIGTTGVNNNITNLITTATMAQQQHQEQIRELLMQQSALRASTTSSQQQRNLEILSGVQEQQQQLMLSTLPSGNDRNNDLQRLLILDRLGRSESIQYTDQELRLLLLQRQNFGGNSNIADNVTPLSSSQTLSEQYQQQQMNLLAASNNMHLRRSTMNNNDLLLHELLMAQSRNTDTRNRYATAATMNDNIGSRFSANALPMRTGQSSTSSSGRTRTDQSYSFNVATASAPMPMVPVGSNLRAAAAARLLSPRNKNSLSTQQNSELKVEEEDAGNYQRNMPDISLLQRQLQNSNALAGRNRDTALAEILDARARYAIGGALDRTTMNIPTSALHQLQRLQNEQQLVAAQDEAFRSATLQSMLASNNPPSALSVQTSNRTTIPNTNIMTIPMQCDSDPQQLSKYQVLIRRQLEYFVSREDDVAYSVQGRKKQIVIGQVGIRCRHCSYLPHRLRGRGAGYYPAKLSGVYQAAQNMATNHLNQHCNVIPAAIREELCSLRGGRHESSAGGGKQYWTNKCSEIGLMEYNDGVYFKGCQVLDSTPNA